MGRKLNGFTVYCSLWVFVALGTIVSFGDTDFLKELTHSGAQSVFSQLLREEKSQVWQQS